MQRKRSRLDSPPRRRLLLLRTRPLRNHVFVRATQSKHQTTTTLSRITTDFAKSSHYDKILSGRPSDVHSIDWQPTTKQIRIDTSTAVHHYISWSGHVRLQRCQHADCFVSSALDCTALREATPACPPCYDATHYTYVRPTLREWNSWAGSRVTMTTTHAARAAIWGNGNHVSIGKCVTYIVDTPMGIRLEVFLNEKIFSLSILV